MARGQLSVEFFLIVAFVLVLATILFSSTENEIRETRAVDRAALAKAAVAGVGNAVNSVALQGNGSVLKKDVFVPPETICFLYNQSASSLYCDTGRTVVRGPTLLAQPSVSPACSSSGWMTATVSSDPNVSISCASLG